ncbi:nucleophosmin 1a isoform X2 [Lampris incognitus]|uniref:nucleophosmin 1a isoform X2 n=1 Tax=Lampris incognitus TaxID=2546036 RepID=UPI0024B60977|nr:nucleophosmin 1a isoform X2 [Lampris incognitus]
MEPKWCVLEPEKDVVFNPENDDFEHQLDLRMACVDSTTKDELHTVEVEGQDIEGQKVKALLVSLKPSTLPSASLGGFMITPPAVFRLKTGSGPIHLSGQHLVIMGGDQSFDEEDDDDEEEELQITKKRPASSPAPKAQKKMKVAMEEAEEDDEDDDDDDDDDEDDEEEEEEEETPVKAKAAASTPKVPAQNGKNATPSATPKQKKTPNKGEKPKKSPQTPKAPLTVPQIKSKLMETMKKGILLPKAQPKFENLVKNGYKVTDAEVMAELWKWRQTVKDAK